MKPLKPAPVQPVDFPAVFTLGDATALKALEAGVADADQQKRALDWVLRHACDLGGIGFRMGAPDALAFHEGRRFAGSQIVGLLKLDTSKIRDDN